MRTGYERWKEAIAWVISVAGVAAIALMLLICAGLPWQTGVGGGP
jgi:hypothetical protein